MSNESMHIGFDFDGVILDHIATKQTIAATLGMTLAAEDTTSERLKEIMPDDLRRTLQELLYNDPEWAFRSPLTNGIEALFSTLQERNIPFSLITRRTQPEITIALLQKHNLWGSVFGEHNTYFVQEPKDKNRVAQEIGVTHYIDDEMKIIRVLHDVPNRYLFDPFDSTDTEQLCTRIRSWAEFSV